MDAEPTASSLASQRGTINEKRLARKAFVTTKARKGSAAVTDALRGSWSTRPAQTPSARRSANTNSSERKQTRAAIVSGWSTVGPVASPLWGYERKRDFATATDPFGISSSPESLVSFMEALTVSLTILIGVCFLLLGRWLYLKPRKMFPAWGLLNREHPGVQKLARVYGVFFIFFGIFASVAVSIAFLLRNVPGLPLLALPIAVVGAWFLRPKVPQPETPVDAASQQPQKQPLLSKHWKRYLAVAGCFAGVLIVAVSLTLGDSDVSKMAVAAAGSNPVVKQRLGDPIKRGLFTSGSIEIDASSGHADLEIPISGPRGKATIYAVAKKSAGIWKFETLDVAFDEASSRVSLLQEQSNTSDP
jgi:hypothetical protein